MIFQFGDWACGIDGEDVRVRDEFCVERCIILELYVQGVGEETCGVERQFPKARGYQYVFGDEVGGIGVLGDAICYS